MRNISDGNYAAGSLASCGLEDGPQDDAIVPWIDSTGIKQEAISAYNYMDVFDDTEFAYIPRNSDEFVSLADNEKFQFTPYTQMY